MLNSWLYKVKGMRLLIETLVIEAQHSEDFRKAFYSTLFPQEFTFSVLSLIEFSDKHTLKVCEKCHGSCSPAFRCRDGISVPSIWPASFALEILIRWTYKVVGKETIHISIFTSKKMHPIFESNLKVRHLNNVYLIGMPKVGRWLVLWNKMYNLYFSTIVLLRGPIL